MCFLPSFYYSMCCTVNADNATVADLIGLTFWKYIEERRGPPVFVRYHTTRSSAQLCVYYVHVVYYLERNTEGAKF